jgi:hypothetical protein
MFKAARKATVKFVTHAFGYQVRVYGKGFTGTTHYALTLQGAMGWVACYGVQTSSVVTVRNWVGYKVAQRGAFYNRAL